LTGVSDGTDVTSRTDVAELDRLVGDWLTVPEVAQALGVEVTRVRQLLKEGQLAAVRRGPSGALHVPAAFVVGGAVLKKLPGTLTVLSDAGYSTEEALRWLFTPEDSLPGSPVQALIENRGTEVRRRAMALGL
jgi:excisionase family DNA binding protein